MTTRAPGSNPGTVAQKTAFPLWFRGMGAREASARRIEPPVKVLAPKAVVSHPGPMSMPPSLPCAKTVPPEIVTVPPAPLLPPPPMPAPEVPPVAVTLPPEMAMSPPAPACPPPMPAA